MATADQHIQSLHHHDAPLYKSSTISSMIAEGLWPSMKFWKDAIKNKALRDKCDIWETVLIYAHALLHVNVKLYYSFYIPPTPFILHLRVLAVSRRWLCLLCAKPGCPHDVYVHLTKLRLWMSIIHAVSHMKQLQKQPTVTRSHKRTKTESVI